MKTIELTEQELAIIVISLTLRQMYFPPDSAGDKTCLKRLRERLEQEVKGGGPP